MGSEKLSVHCSMIVYHVHQIERREGAVRGPCFEAAGVQSEGGDGGWKGKNGHGSGEARRYCQERGEPGKRNGGSTAATKGTISSCCSTGSPPNHNDLMDMRQYRKLEEHRQENIPTNLGAAKVGLQ